MSRQSGGKAESKIRIWSGFGYGPQICSGHYPGGDYFCGLLIIDLYLEESAVGQRHLRKRFVNSDPSPTVDYSTSRPTTRRMPEQSFNRSHISTALSDLNAEEESKGENCCYYSMDHLRNRRCCSDLGREVRLLKPISIMIATHASDEIPAAISKN